MAIENIGSLVDLVKTVHGRISGHVVSLPEYTKGTNVMSRLYTEEQLSNEDIILPVISTLNQLYAGYVLTALQLNQYVTGSKTVRDILQLVATESFTDVVDIANESFGSINYDDVVTSMEATKIVDLEPASQRLMSGRVIELELKVGTDEKATVIKIALYVQLIPYLLKSEVVAGFIGLNFNPGLRRRFTQLKVGDIGVRDFVFARDLVTDYRKAMKSDKSGVLSEMLEKQSNSLSKSITSLIGLAPKKHNLASSIVIIEKRNFDRACAKAGISFRNISDRQRFFKQSFTMIVVVIDTLYNTVDMYFNGIDHVGNYTYNMINKLTKGGDKFDLKDIMSAFGQGGAPKF